MPYHSYYTADTASTLPHRNVSPSEVARRRVKNKAARKARRH